MRNHMQTSNRKIEMTTMTTIGDVDHTKPIANRVPSNIDNGDEPERDQTQLERVQRSPLGWESRWLLHALTDAHTHTNRSHAQVTTLMEKSIRSFTSESDCVSRFTAFFFISSTVDASLFRTALRNFFSLGFVLRCSFFLASTDHHLSSC